MSPSTWTLWHILTSRPSRSRCTRLVRAPKIGKTSLEELARDPAVGALPDGKSALNLAAAGLRHIAGNAWSSKRYLNFEPLKDQELRGAITA